MTPLPIDSHLPEIVDALSRSGALVIVAAPGAGKTTRVPPAILRAGLLSAEHPNLIMLQPRRVAARAAAARIAEENGWEIGGHVGYHIRFENRLGPKTRLQVLTEGVLTRKLLDDPLLEGVGAVVLDEFHERSIHSDLAIAMLRETRTVRPELRIVVMSATLEAGAAARFLGDCPIIEVPGRLFPVEIEYRPRDGAAVADAVAAMVSEAVERAGGDLLAFLPGAGEINQAARILEALAARLNLDVLPLHGSLPPEQQTLALRRSPRRKVILATNIAETSLTIDGVTVVIDGGLARVPMFDINRGLDRLELKQISQASAAQRAGRAGRTAPGRCVRLWSAKQQAQMEQFEIPEVHRVDLCGAVLTLHGWGKPDPREFGWFDSPPAELLESAQRTLEMLTAVDADGRLSTLGKRLLKLPMHPRIGRLLCAAADAGCPNEGAALAALLSEKDILDNPPAMAGPSDLLVRLDLLHAHDNVDPMAARRVIQVQKQLQQLTGRLGSKSARKPSVDLLLKIILQAYPDRVCRRRASDPSAGVMVGGGGVRLATDSVVRKGEFFVAVDASHDPRSPSRQAKVRQASAIRVEWLAEMFPESITRQRQIVFDPQRQRVVAISQTRYRDLVIAEDQDAPLDGIEAGQVLTDALRPRAAEIFAADERAATLLARVALLRESMSEHAWPPLDQPQLEAALDELCRGKRSVSEITRGQLAEALENLLGYPLDGLLRQHAPETIAVPSGNRIHIDYAIGQPPVLAVRIQEIFGWKQTPRIAAGRVPILLHLLGPHGRPVQITDDLPSFWSGAYFQVRKDLRVRYPKHSWPDDPYSAVPQAKGKRRVK
jgi:ATP-dependent helicase HrpB